jgi:CheY-like chemotaxis protein
MARVLIADRDHAISLLLQTAVCRVTECDVTLVHDAAAAAEALRSRTFDLVLLDIGMYSDGLRTLEHIQGRNDHCEIIALTTGVIQAPLVKILAAANVFAVVTKPFDVNQLAALVVESVRGDRAGDANPTRVYRTPGDEPTLE